MIVDVKISEMNIFSDMVNIINEVTGCKLISNEIGSYYENKIHPMIEVFEKERVDWRKCNNLNDIEK
jgi:hypothetical protein